MTTPPDPKAVGQHPTKGTPMSERYGAKCGRCTHVEHHGAEGLTREPVGWLRLLPLECEDCLFCQEAALTRALAEHGLGIFPPETRAVVHAFERGEQHPALDALALECRALMESLDFLGARWRVVDAQRHEADDMDGATHWHLTLTKEADGG